MDLDFSKIKYDVHKLNENDKCIDRYKDLQFSSDVFEQDDLPKGITPDFFMRFLILTYTPSSPFVEIFTDLSKRKIRVLEYLGIDSEEKITVAIQDMCSLNGVCFLFRWVRFLRIQYNETWAALCTAEDRFYSILEPYKAVHEDPSKEKSKNEVLKDLVKQIRDLKKDFLVGEKSKEAEEAVSFSITNESLGMRPEEYVPLWSRLKKLPYELENI